MKPKAILFDLDGTLIEFPKDFLFSQAYQVFDSLEMEHASEEELEEAFSDFDFFRIAPAAVREQFMEVYWSLFDWNQYPKAVVIPGVTETLASLKASGFELGIVTSRDESPEHIRQRLEHTNILEHLSFIIPRSCPDCEWSDKSKQITEACKRLGLSPEEVAMVGDIPPDIESAHKCGVGIKIALLSGGIKRRQLEKGKPDFILSTVNEVVGLEVFGKF